MGHSSQRRTANPFLNETGGIRQLGSTMGITRIEETAEDFFLLTNIAQTKLIWVWLFSVRNPLSIPVCRDSGTGRVVAELALQIKSSKLDHYKFITL